MPAIKKFIGNKKKSKGFLVQIKIKIDNEGLVLTTVLGQVVYVGLLLGGDLLVQFKPYLTEIQKNGLTITNLEAKYIFLLQEGFTSRLTQIFKDLEAEATAEYKLEDL